MAEGTTCKAIQLYCYTVLLSTTLQAVGFITPGWVTDGCCPTGGLFNDYCQSGTAGKCPPPKDTTSPSRGLETTALVFYLLSVFFSANLMFCMLCCMSIYCARVASIFFLAFYPLGGLFSLCGCVAVIVRFPFTSLSYSFYLCLISGLYTFFQIIYGIYLWNKSSSPGTFGWYRVGMVYITIHVIAKRTTVVDEDSETISLTAHRTTTTVITRR